MQSIGQPLLGVLNELIMYSPTSLYTISFQFCSTMLSIHGVLRRLNSILKAKKGGGLRARCVEIINKKVPYVGTEAFFSSAAFMEQSVFLPLERKIEFDNLSNEFSSFLLILKITHLIK